ncbi:putative transcription factor C2H2 family [Rosa chinensis]|uniref:RING-type E3 ubiquitin transferase n=1 Tax=Rosa chinensis TaxID=74649 RepID=A0A2P6Q7B7_ROSCH|nr:RING-H2 finger protein ATL74 [Rosa chinensis]PRQ30083.1 putative transcription factor C2H2 family [Rosa chinensis]
MAQTPPPTPIPTPTPGPTSIRTVLLRHQNPPDHDINPPPHDLNVMIILAAICCAFVCALGLNSMLQCVFQCVNRAITEPVRWVASRRLNSGLKKKEMVALPTSTYSNSSSSSPSPSSSPGCAICLVDFSDGDKIRVLPKCNHRFHVVCIDKWLQSHSSCPTCRQRLKSSSDSMLSPSEIVTT